MQAKHTIWMSITDAAQDLGKWKLFKVAGHYVKFQTLLAALGLFLAGLILGRLMSRWLRKSLSKSDTFSDASVELTARWVRVLVTFGFLIPALNVLGLPMKAFSFLGGAIALGFGFGAQNLCSNIISGLIILATRPYRRGDIVEIEGQPGVVNLVGLRATEVTTYDGVRLLVPNSVILQNVVVNRTNADHMIRGNVALAVAYDSDTREVAGILQVVASAHPAVVKTEDKMPWVILEDFQESGILFRTYFWVDVTKKSVALTASELRHDMFEAVKRAGISIPYPRLEVDLRRKPGKKPAE